jgi:hypothetical protein
MIDIKHCVDNWDYRHFLAYMYVAVANSDYEVTEDELDELHTKLASTIFGEEDYQDMYNEVLRIYNKQNDSKVYDCLATLSKKHITTEEQKQKVLNDIHDIIDADGHESGSEKIMFMSIRKILNNIV